MTLSGILQILREHGLYNRSHTRGVSETIDGKVCTDNRDVREGDIFVCIKGLKADGHSFIADARQKKAAFVVCEDELTDALPAIRVSDSRKAAALLAKLYYKNPSSRFRLVGITGTNGKTTTSMLLFKAVRELDLAAGWIGTLGYYINEKHYTTQNTTPDIIELNRIFSAMAEEGVDCVFMEVSSHALSLDRVYGVEFDFCLFTNLSRDHLDFHKDMTDYAQSKLKLFQGAIDHQAVALFNIDDEFGLTSYQNLASKNAFVFSVGSTSGDFIIRKDLLSSTNSSEQSRFTLQCQDGMINIRSPLIGKFNIENLALSAATLNLMGLEKRQIEQGLNSVQSVAGRLERVPNSHGIGVFVDYAHTPDAIENVLQAVSAIGNQNIFCLFGAGGDRDKGKRPLMLQAALKYSNAVIISDDNPRSENPNGIIREIVSGSDIWLPWWIIRDRREAIHAILRLAQPGDVVILCGKGHETYQEIEGVRHQFDDVEVAREFLAAIDLHNPESSELAVPVDGLMLELLCDHVNSLATGYQEPRTFRRISTDSRSIQPGSVFFALQGLNFDGHDYLGDILADKTNAAVVQKLYNGIPNQILVPCPLTAMSLLYRKYLLMFDIYKIAITGSTGKSSTKELLAQVFDAQAPTLKTEANENNLIGLCKTIARIKPEQRYAVFELGTNAFGEIATLSDVCSPDAGIILNIGPSHLEYLINEDGVYKEKVTLFNRPLDIRLFDGDDTRFDDFLSTGKSIGYDLKADYRIENVVCDTDACKFKLFETDWTIPYSAQHFVKNVAFAIAMGIHKGVSCEDIQKALNKPIRLDMRLQLERYNHCLLLADCYNANPVSMQSAIEYWHRLKPESEHIAILGDMLELGASAREYHDMIAAILGDKGYDLLITVGEFSARYHGQNLSDCDHHFATVDDLIASGILTAISQGSVVLVKGSHSMHLERTLRFLRKEM